MTSSSKSTTAPSSPLRQPLLRRRRLTSSSQRTWDCRKRIARAFTEEQLNRIHLVKPAPAAPVPAATSSTQSAAAPATNAAQTVTLEGYIKQAPPAIQDVLNNGLAVYNAEKQKLVDLILANKRNGFTKQELEAKALPELKNLAQLASSEEQPQRVPIYGGQAPVQVGNEAEEALVMPTINYGKQ